MLDTILVRLADGPLRTDICIPADPVIRVGRVETHSSGRGWQVRIDADTIIDRQGESLTVSEAQKVLDLLEAKLQAKGAMPCR